MAIGADAFMPCFVGGELVRSIWRTILGVVFVGEDGEVALIARRGYQMVFDGLQHGTSRFVGVGAV